jgi:hypothetical protein
VSIWKLPMDINEFPVARLTKVPVYGIEGRDEI